MIPLTGRLLGLASLKPVNILTNSRWAGGPPPTGWSSGSGTGTATYITSTIDPLDTACHFQATAARPYIQQNVGASAVGDAYTLSINVEAVVDVSTLTWANLIWFAGPVVLSSWDFNGITTNPSAVIGSLPLGRIYARAVCTVASASTTLRFGIGGANSATGDITISRPMVTRGRLYKPYERT